MGLRGPSAKSIKPAASAAPASASAPHPWEAPGLSMAQRVILFVESLPCTAGQWEGTNFRLRPWQKKEIRRIYRTGADGRRIVRTVCWSTARGNGKTGLAAVLALAHLVGPCSEARGEVYAAANDRFQAGRLFSEVCAIIQRVPWLAARISIRRHSKELEDIGGTGSFFAALSADVPSKHGLSPSFVCVDELGQSVSRDLLDTLETGMIKRVNPMLWIISTQAARDDMPMSQIVEYGLRVRRGEIDDPSFHLVLHTAPATADPWKRSTWRMANPGLGDIVSLEHIARLARQAAKLPSAEASFRNLVLNQRIDATAHFLTASVWAACSGPVDASSLRGRPAFAGIDLGSTRDLTALVTVFRDDDGAFDVVPFFWLPGDDLREREDTDHAPYCQWRDQGILTTVPGKTMDYGVVARKLAELNSVYHFQGIGFDRWKIADLRRELSAIGAELPLIDHGMGFKDMRHAVDTLEKFAIDGNLRHAGNPLLAWCISNARTTADPTGARKLDKSRSVTGRIDGAVALAVALSVATRHEPPAEWTPFLAIA